MNNDRRKAIAALHTRLEELQTEVTKLTSATDVDSLKADVETIRDEEQEYHDNMPESLQAGDKGQAASDAVDNLETALDKLGEVSEVLTTLSDNFTKALEALDNSKAT